MRNVFFFCIVMLTAAPALAADDTWVEPMRTVHERFTGMPGTFAHFGDSITYSMAFWAPLQWEPKKATERTQRARRTVSAYMHEDCWRKWKGAQYGNAGGKTVAWALRNVETWLRKLNPEVVLVMFGTNDLNNVAVEQYEKDLRRLVKQCLDNGSVVILSTIPPRSGMAEKAKAFAAAARRTAKDLKVPLTDFHAAVMQRRPDDWDGSAKRFADFKTYEVPTLIAGDGVHPSNPAKWRGDFTDEGLKHNGFNLRSHLVLTAYAEVIRQVLAANPAARVPGPEPHGQTVRVADPRELHAAAAKAAPGDTILLSPGRYRLARRLEIRTDRLTVRGASGKREEVILDGDGIGELVAFTRCAEVRVADLTIENVRWNGFKINSETGVQQLTIENCVIHNVWQRGVKGVIVPEKNRAVLRPTGCMIRHCLFYNDRPKQFSDDPADKPGRRFDGNYIGAIDVMYPKEWEISDNVFMNIQGRTREGRGAVFLWHEAEDCVVERNVIVDCDKGICLGNAFLPKDRGVRLHARRCVVRNNFITRAPEAGILAAHTAGCRIVNNTVHEPKSRLRRLVRILGATGELLVADNILSGPPPRVETASGVTLKNNLIRDMTAAFADPAKGNLHLKKPHRDIVDRAAKRAAVTLDIDRQQRGPKPDIGADEFGERS